MVLCRLSAEYVQSACSSINLVGQDAHDQSAERQLQAPLRAHHDGSLASAALLLYREVVDQLLHAETTTSGQTARFPIIYTMCFAVVDNAGGSLGR